MNLMGRDCDQHLNVRIRGCSRTVEKGRKGKKGREKKEVERKTPLKKKASKQREDKGQRKNDPRRSNKAKCLKGIKRGVRLTTFMVLLPRGNEILHKMVLQVVYHHATLLLSYGFAYLPRCLSSSSACLNRELGAADPEGRKIQHLLSRPMMNMDEGVSHTPQRMPLFVSRTVNSPRNSFSFRERGRGRSLANFTSCWQSPGDAKVEVKSFLLILLSNASSQEDNETGEAVLTETL
ncbi:hypothetical protein E5288_WYG013558 [Bos mutus]|uniref:Uncharacterized protein n=1 Tax=Bos mutus TaxID=72004 RepID=A0A6B0QT46_9CETA|nr:hypothetical protein [Bos mutus]